MASERKARLVIIDAEEKLTGVLDLADVVESAPGRQSLQTVRAIMWREALGPRGGAARGEPLLKDDPDVKDAPLPSEEATVRRPPSSSAASRDRHHRIPRLISRPTRRRPGRRPARRWGRRPAPAPPRRPPRRCAGRCTERGPARRAPAAMSPPSDTSSRSRSGPELRRGRQLLPRPGRERAKIRPSSRRRSFRTRRRPCLEAGLDPAPGGDREEQRGERQREVPQQELPARQRDVKAALERRHDPERRQQIEAVERGDHRVGPRLVAGERRRRLQPLGGPARRARSTALPAPAVLRTALKV